jgi:Putative restriction endonuclease
MRNGDDETSSCSCKRRYGGPWGVGNEKPVAVEVASPSTAPYDRNRKRTVYEEFGIPSYWIVNPDAGRPDLTALELRDGHFEQIAHVAGGEMFEATIPFPVRIVPVRLVTAEPQR